MARSSNAQEWAWANLRGIGDSLDTPLYGVDGDEIDWSALLTPQRLQPGQDVGTRCLAGSEQTSKSTRPAQKQSEHRCGRRDSNPQQLRGQGVENQLYQAKRMTTHDQS